MLYANSVIQYIQDRNLRKIVKIANPRYLQLDDLLLGNQRQYFTLQNYYEDQIPTVIRNQEEFIKMLRRISIDFDETIYVGAQRKSSTVTDVRSAKRIKNKICQIYAV